MRIRSKEHFIDALSKESSWRKQELTNILFSLKSARAGNQELAIRSAIALIYAHWEGFIKNSSEFFLGYLSFLGLRGNEVSPILRKTYLQIKAINMGELRGFSNFGSFLSYCETEYPKATLDWDHRKVVSTKSNLKFETFSEIALKIGIDITSYSTKQAKIDSLVHLRNSVAHGEKPRIALEEAIEYVEIIRELLEHYKTDLENSIVQGSYRARVD